MPRVRRIKRLPANFDAFIGEVAEGMEQVYGPEAVIEYRDSAQLRVQATVSHESVDTLAAMAGEDAHAMLMSLVHEGTGQIFFLHVLKGHEGEGLESALLGEAVRTLRSGGVDGIVCETLVFNPHGRLPAFEELGFLVFDRAIMTCELDEPALALSEGPLRSRPLKEADYPRAADCLAAAYRGEPDVELHREMTNPDGALGLIENLAAGGFGAFHATFARCIGAGGTMESVLLGCEAVAKVGFVVQVATPREYRGRGHATALVRETAQAFREAGLLRLALGVTLDNPARYLYEGLGMRVRRPVFGYAWWRPGV